MNKPNASHALGNISNNLPPDQEPITYVSNTIDSRWSSNLLWESTFMRSSAILSSVGTLSTFTSFYTYVHSDHPVAPEYMLGPLMRLWFHS